jgi:AsmA protein
MKKRTKLLLWVAGGAVALIVVLLVALPFFVDVNRYRDLIEAKARDALGREVRLGEMQLSLLPTVGLRVDDLAIGALPEEGGGDLLTARRLRVGARLMPLLRKQLEVTSITIEAPQLSLTRGADGRWNVQRLVASQPAAEAGGGPSSSGVPQFQIDRLRISDGRVSLRDEAAPGGALVLTLAALDVELRDVNPQRSIGFEASAEWEEMPDSAVALSGELGPLFPADGEALRVEVTAEASHLDAGRLVELVQSFYPLPDGLVGGDELSAAAHVELDRAAVTQVAVSGIRVEGIELSLRRDRNGELNLPTPAASRAAPGSTTPRDLPASGAPMELTLSGLEVVDATLRFEDAGGLLPAISIDGLDLSLDRLPFEKPARLELAGLVNGTGRLQLQGDFGPVGAEGETIPLAVHVGLDPIPNELLRALASAGVDLDTTNGKAAVDVNLSGRAPRELRAQGSAGFTGFRARLAGPAGATNEIPLNLDADYDVTVFDSGSKLQIADLDLKLSGNPLSLHGTIERDDPLTRLDLEILPFSIPADELSALLALVVSDLPISFQSDSPIEAQAQVRGLTGAGRIPHIDGKAKLKGFTLMHSALEQPVSNLGADVTLKGEQIRLERLTGVIGSSDFAGDVSVNGFLEPHIDFDVRSKRADFGELFSFLNSDAPAATSPASDSAAGQSQSPPADPLAGMILEGKIGIASGAFDTLEFSDLEAAMRWADGTLTLDPVTMQLYDGAFSGTVTSDLSSTQPTFDIKGDAKGVDMDGFLRNNLGSPGLLYGKFYGEVDTHTTGADYEAIVRGLKGSGSVEVQEGRVGGLDILERLSKVSGVFGEDTLRSLSDRLADEGTEFRVMTGGVHFDGGQMQIDSLVVESDDFRLQGAGLVDMLEAIMDGDFQLSLSPELSASMRAESSRAGKLLWNSRTRRVEVPFSLSGPFQAPMPSVDWGQIAETAVQSRAEDEIRNFLTKKLGKEKKDESPPPVEPTVPEPAQLQAQAEAVKSAPASPPVDGLIVKIENTDWRGSLLAPDLRVEGSVHGSSIERAELSVIDSRGVEIRRNDRLRDVDDVVARAAKGASRMSIPWKYELDGKRVLLARFPITLRVVVYDTSGASVETSVEVDR